MVATLALGSTQSVFTIQNCKVPGSPEPSDLFFSPVNGLSFSYLSPSLAGDCALASPVGRTSTKGLPEESAQMGLIRKANAQGYFAQWLRAGHHQVAGSLQTPSHHVGMRRIANGKFEFP